MKHFINADKEEFWQTPTGWIVKLPGTEPVWVGAQSTWPDSDMVQVVPGTPAPTPVPVPTPTPTPTPVPVPVPVPTPPNPEDISQYDLVPVYVDKLEAGWVNRSWAPTTEVDEGGGNKAFESDIDAWKGFNLNGPSRKIEDFAGAVFDFKASAVNDKVTMSFYDGLTKLGTGMQLVGTSTDTQRITALFSKMGMSLFGTFTNIVVEGGDSNQRSPMRFDNIYLLKRKAALPLPPAPPMTAAPATGGWLTINAQGKFIDESGAQWTGRGVNIPDNKLFNAGASLALPAAFGELKRRVSWAVGELKIDFVRYCVHQDAGVQKAGDAWWEGVKDFVTWCWQTHKVRVLFSFWREGTLKGLTQAPTAASIPAWKMVTKAFANSGHVLFGLTNEPQTNAPGDWEAFNEVCKEIRWQEAAVGGRSHVIAVQGLSGWARNIAAYETKRITAPGPIAYEVHAYDKHPDFYERFVRLSKVGMPIIMGEFGPAVVQNKTSVANYNNLALGDDLYWSLPREQAEIVQLCKDNGIPMAAWALSCRAWPDLIVDNTNGGGGVGMPLQLTAWGEMLKGLYSG